MTGLNERDLEVLTYYASHGNRERYWNYLANLPGNDGYGLLALGVVRNDSMPGAVANVHADSVARKAGVRMGEAEWERFGRNLMITDLEVRREYVHAGQSQEALNLPVKKVQEIHDTTFRNARIDPNAWTPRQLLEAARREDGEAGAEKVWRSMLDNGGLGLGRGGRTVGQALDHMSPLQAGGYIASLAASSAVASQTRDQMNPDVIGSKTHYYTYDRKDRAWSFVSDGGQGMPEIQPVTDRRQLRELNEIRELRLERQQHSKDIAPGDPHGQTLRSPFTITQTESQDDGTRLAASPGSAQREALRHLDPRLLDAVRERMPAGTNEGHVQAATVAAMQINFKDPACIDKFACVGDTFLMRGDHTTGYGTVKLSLQEPPPPLSELQAQLDTLSQTRQQELANPTQKPAMQIG